MAFSTYQPRPRARASRVVARAGPPSCPDPRVARRAPRALLFVPALVAIAVARAALASRRRGRCACSRRPRRPRRRSRATSTRSRRSTRCSRSSRARPCGSTAPTSSTTSAVVELERLADKLEAAAALARTRRLAARAAPRAPRRRRSRRAAPSSSGCAGKPCLGRAADATLLLLGRPPRRGSPYAGRASPSPRRSGAARPRRTIRSTSLPPAHTFAPSTRQPRSRYHRAARRSAPFTSLVAERLKARRCTADGPRSRTTAEWPGVM